MAETVNSNNNAVKHTTTDRLSQFHRDAYCSEPLKASACRKLSKKGPRCRPINIDFTENPTRLPAKYSIYKSERGQKTYDVTVPIVFLKPGKVFGDRVKGWRREVNSCLARNRPYLTDGQRFLNIRVSTGSHINDPPSKITFRSNSMMDTGEEARSLHSHNSNEVNIVKDLKRSNSEEWADNIDCPTMIHEVLHLLALCDHYKETEITYKPDPSVFNNKLGIRLNKEDIPRQKSYDCRKVSKEHNLLNNQNDIISGSREWAKGIIKAGKPKMPFKKTTYNCSCSLGSECTANIQKTVEWGFPVEVLECKTTEVLTTHNKPDEIHSRTTTSVSFSTTRNSDERPLALMILKQKPNYKSGLSVEQVDTILHPLCMTNKRVKKYYEINQNAYRNRYSKKGCL